MEQTLNARLQRSEDIQAIKDLRARYAYAANIIDGRAGDIKAFAALFAPDGTFDPGMGVATGPAEIEAMMTRMTVQWQCAMHYMLNPVIELAGDTARGTFTGLIAFVGHDDPAPIWLSTIYTDTYVRTPDGWRFQSVQIATAFAEPAFFAAYANLPAAG